MVCRHRDLLAQAASKGAKGPNELKPSKLMQLIKKQIKDEVIKSEKKAESVQVGKLKKLGKRPLEPLTRFKVSLRKVTAKGSSTNVAEVVVEIDRNASVLNKKFYFSQDANYFFIILAGEDGKLWRSVTFDSQTLQHAPDLDLDLQATFLESIEYCP